MLDSNTIIFYLYYKLNELVSLMEAFVVFHLPESTIKSKDSIRKHLACLIIGGSFETDEILPNEVALAEGFGVSRTLMRDLLRSLEEKGLIERKPQVGTRARSIHSWNLLDEEVLDWCCETLPPKRFYVSLLELRMIIEPQAAALAATRANDDDIQRISRTYKQMVKNENADSAIDTEGDIAFHQAIIRASGNIFISQFRGAIRAALYHTIHMSVRAAEDHAESIANHKRLLDAIERRNPEQAYSAMVDVLKRAMIDMGIEKYSLVLPETGSVTKS